MFRCCSLETSHPLLLPQSLKDCSINLCLLFFCSAYRVIINIILNSIYMCRQILYHLSNQEAHWHKGKQITLQKVILNPIKKHMKLLTFSICSSFYFLEFEWTLGGSEGQGSLACCSPRGHKESDTIEWLNKNNHYFLRAVLIPGY